MRQLALDSSQQSLGKVADNAQFIDIFEINKECAILLGRCYMERNDRIASNLQVAF
jgi:hypothetical protein